MIVTFQGQVLAFPNATQAGWNKLAGTMQLAVSEHNAAGRPNSGDRA